MSFVIKSLAPIVAGGGLGTGGVYIYRGVMPTTWQEYLEREGFQILDTAGSENKEFKAIFVEHEELIKSKTEDSYLKDANEIKNYSKIKEYCSNKLKENTDGNATTKDQVIKLCTYSGISTVKAKITESKKENNSDLNWIKDSQEDEKYKTIFAVYKYSNTFLEWLNEGRGDNKLKQSDKASEKYSDLKKKCQEESKKKHEEYKSQKQVYNKVYWWCVALSYDTVEGRIKAVEPTWEKETAGSAIKTEWQYTNSVKNVIKTDQGKGTEDPGDNDYSSWCSTQSSKKLYEENVYQDKYLKVKAVCRKKKQQD